MSEIEHFLSMHDQLGEGSLWSAAEQALYWVDIRNKCYHRFDAGTGACETVMVGARIGVMAQRVGGGLVMATDRGFAFWDARAQVLEEIINPEAGRPSSIRFNDGAVDCRGRFWAGSMQDPNGSEPQGTLYRLDPDGSVHAMIRDVGIPNGIGWSPDNSRMYFTDSSLGTIYSYDFDAERGEITHRQVFASLTGTSAVPDGLTVDSQGYVWCACWDGARIERYSPAGERIQVIELPVLRPTSCVFGGPNMNELYITSAYDELTEEEVSQYPHSGDIFRLRTDVVGLKKFLFAG